MSIVVVGAGLTGLVAAHELRRAGASVLVLNADRRAGGVILTERPPGGWVVEGGPDGFLRADPEVPTLAAELGVANRIVAQQATGSLAWDGRQLTPLAAGTAAELLDIDTRNLDLSAGFATFRDGMGELVAALGAHSPPQVGSVTTVVSQSGGLRVSGTNGISLDCRGLVLALPAFAAAPLIASLDSSARQVLESIPYHQSVNVSIAYRREQVAHPLDAAGFAAASETGIVRACTFASSKFPERAPHGHVLLRAFLAGSTDSGPAAHRALVPILGISGVPLWAREFVWPRGIPRYEAGHAERVAEARHRLARVGPIALAGAGYDGAGVSACVRSGRTAARGLLQRLSYAFPRRRSST